MSTGLKMHAGMGRGGAAGGVLVQCVCVSVGGLMLGALRCRLGHLLVTESLSVRPPGGSTVTVKTKFACCSQI